MGRFCPLAIVAKDAGSTGVWDLSASPCQFLDHVVGVSSPSSTVAAPCTLPPAVPEGCDFATSLPAFVRAAVPVCAKRRLLVAWPEGGRDLSRVLCGGASPDLEQEQGQEASWRPRVSGA